MAVLRTEVPPEAREAWYERELRAGTRVFACHPKLVQTGLDLVFCETILFYETGYSIYVLRQASRRSWRIGQTRPVKVKFLHYDETMQESCLRLMGKKLLVSMAMEGKFSAEGLQAVDDGDDMLMAMARELVTEKGIGENADAIWRQLQKRRQEVFGVGAAETRPLSDEAVEPVLDTAPGMIVPPPSGAPSLATQMLMFGASLESAQRRKASRRSTAVAAKTSNQLALF